MQLDKFTDYALRLLMTLSAMGPRRVSSSHIAGIFDLSEHHLSKVASALVREGFVISERGRNGGLVLAQPPEDISVGAVVRALRGTQPVVECFGSNTSCRILPVCGLRSPLQKAQEAFFATLDDYTLADITGPPASLKMLLTAQ
jgi:Rrf2 family nitric oxide-sensitive transcriptional repressor